MAVDVQANLERELYEVKQYASDLSKQVENFKKELGNSRKQAAKVPELNEEKAALAAALEAKASEVKALEAALAKADAKAAKADEAIAAGKAIHDALVSLSAL